MSDHKTFFGKIFAWIGKVFTHIVKDAAPVAVAVTDFIKTALNSQVVGFLTTLIDGLSKVHIASEIVTFLNKEIPKVLAIELSIQGIPDNPTEQDLLDFEKRLFDAFGKVSDKSRFYTEFATQVYSRTKSVFDTTPETAPTFAEIVSLIEACYQDYLNDQNQAPEDAQSL